MFLYGLPVCREYIAATVGNEAEHDPDVSQCRDPARIYSPAWWSPIILLPSVVLLHHPFRPAICRTRNRRPISSALTLSTSTAMK